MSGNESTALAPTIHKGLTRTWNLLPGSLGEAKELATIIASSEFAPKDYKGKPESVIIAIQMGADVGLSPMQALQNIAVINGRPSIWGDAALALVMPVLERFQETFEGEFPTSDFTAICVAKRKGWPDETIRKFSISDARKANLWDKAGPWKTYPHRMLQMRARGFALRDVGADRLLGFILAEEAQDIPSETSVGFGATVQAKSMSVFESLPEPMRDNVEKAFSTLNFSEAQRLQKLNEFLAGDDVVPEEGALRLLEWLKDEYAKRKTGQPRAKKDENRKPRAAKEPVPETTTPPPTSATEEPPTPTEEPKDGEVLFE